MIKFFNYPNLISVTLGKVEMKEIQKSSGLLVRIQDITKNIK